MVRVQVHIMSHKVEEDYNKKVEQEQNERTQEQLLEALDKIRAPICVCEIGQADTKILFANHTWTTLAGAPRECPTACLTVCWWIWGTLRHTRSSPATCALHACAWQNTRRNGAVIRAMPGRAIM